MKYDKQALQTAERLLPLKKIDEQAKGKQIESRISKGMADAYYRIGTLEANKNNYTEALENYFLYSLLDNYTSYI